jgi:RNA polymerase sigma-70 factor (ECF subfamily)
MGVPDETEIHGAASDFPHTSWTVVLAAKNEGQLDDLIRRYWKPVYWLIRRRWNKSNEDAKDLTQEFFMRLVERNRLERVGPEHGRFRAYLSALLMNFLRNRHEAERAAKRGGGARLLSLDAGDETPPAFAEGQTPEEMLDRAWAWNIFQRATEHLRARYRTAGKEVFFDIFEAYELEDDPPSYKELASRYRLPASSVESHLRQARIAFERVLRSLVRETLADDADLEAELLHLGSVMGR